MHNIDKNVNILYLSLWTLPPTTLNRTIPKGLNLYNTIDVQLFSVHKIMIVWWYNYIAYTVQWQKHVRCLNTLSLLLCIVCVVCVYMGVRFNVHEFNFRKTINIFFAWALWASFCMSLVLCEWMKLHLCLWFKLCIIKCE